MAAAPPLRLGSEEEARARRSAAVQAQLQKARAEAEGREAARAKEAQARAEAVTDESPVVAELRGKVDEAEREVAQLRFEAARVPRIGQQRAFMRVAEAEAELAGARQRWRDGLAALQRVPKRGE